MICGSLEDKNVLARANRQYLNSVLDYGAPQLKMWYRPYYNPIRGYGAPPLQMWYDVYGKHFRRSNLYKNDKRDMVQDLSALGDTKTPLRIAYVRSQNRSKEIKNPQRRSWSLSFRLKRTNPTNAKNWNLDSNSYYRLQPFRRIPNDEADDVLNFIGKPYIMVYEKFILPKQIKVFEEKFLAFAGNSIRILAISNFIVVY